MKDKVCLLLFRALTASLLATAAIAAPITYTAFTDTDGKIGSWSFHNARVYLTFHGDTSNVQTIDVPNIFITGTMTEAVLNATGTASVTIITAQKTVHARFLPNQLFVSLDHGTLPGPFQGGRGVGFGMFSATAAGGIEPTYPLAFEDGTIDWGDALTPSAAIQSLSTDLKHSTVFSGRALSCINFPADLSCSAPAPALKTDKGDFFLYAPYLNVIAEDELNGGFFTAHLGEEESGDSESSGGGDESGMSQPAQSSRSKKPITYTGALISNAKLDGHVYQNAQIYISFDADRSTALPFQDAQSAGYINATGQGRLKIVHGSSVTSADFAPNQLYAYFDKTHGSVGIGSKAGGRGYPFTVTRNEDVQGLVENSTIGAITDILSGTRVTDFTPQTATLVTDLTNQTVLSGAASSCVSFDPATSVCSALTPIALKTSAGDFYLYEPYTDDETPIGNSPPDGTHPYSINWGVWWSEIPALRE
jgi:hypothetical protein